LIVACGCRGRLLAAELRARGHQVRGTTRRDAALTELESAGVEAVLADPDRVVTLAPTLAQVSVVCVLLGTATGSPAAVAALHGPRLEMLLTKLLDTSVRGIVYESAGSVDCGVLDSGASLVQSFCERSRIPFALLERDPSAGHAAWVAAATACVERLLA
jgi:putative NADH-flavin reductase